MAWKTMDIHEQRVRFVVEATQKLRSFSAVCAEFDISRPNGISVAEALSELRCSRDHRAESQASLQPTTDGQPPGAARRASAAALSGSGAHASCVWCWREKAWNYPEIRFIAFYCATIWSAKKTAISSHATIRTQSAQRTLADGLQRAEGMAATDGAAVGARRS